MESKKLHLGCGEKYLPGYLHMDIRAFDHVDYVGDVKDLSQFAKETFDEIYACHVLEHIGRHQVLAVLQEWSRVLIRGGLLRIAVPDFEAITSEYMEHGKLERVIGLLYGGQNYEANYHYVTFDFNLISGLLRQAGFSAIERYDWRSFLPVGYDMIIAEPICRIWTLKMDA